MKKKHKAQIILVASLKSTNHPKQYIKNCFKCKRTVYLLDKWQDKKNAEYICTECFFSQKLKKGDIIKIDELMKQVNAEYDFYKDEKFIPER